MSRLPETKRAAPAPAGGGSASTSAGARLLTGGLRGSTVSDAHEKLRPGGDEDRARTPNDCPSPYPATGRASFDVAIECLDGLLHELGPALFEPGLTPAQKLQLNALFREGRQRMARFELARDGYIALVEGGDATGATRILAMLVGEETLGPYLKPRARTQIQAPTSPGSPWSRPLTG